MSTLSMMADPIPRAVYPGVVTSQLARYAEIADPRLATAGRLQKDPRWRGQQADPKILENWMRKPASVRSLEQLGRVRLSASFFMRDFLHSEIAEVHGIANIPDDPAVAIAAGQHLCAELLEPLQATFGRLAIRSAYRSPAVNALGNERGLSCASNKRNYARHIWDRRDARGCMGRLPRWSSPGLRTAMPRVPTGRRWPGGSMTISRTASCSSSVSSPPSISAGMSTREGGSTALSRHVDV